MHAGNVQNYNIVTCSGLVSHWIHTMKPQHRERVNAQVHSSMGVSCSFTLSLVLTMLKGHECLTGMVYTIILFLVRYSPRALFFKMHSKAIHKRELTTCIITYFLFIVCIKLILLTCGLASTLWLCTCTCTVHDLQLIASFVQYA